MTHPAADPEALLSDVLAYIEEAHGILEKGEWVDLKGLDARVERLCLEIVTLTPEQSREFAAELEFLRTKLDALQADMQEKVSQLKADIAETNTVQRANRAYVQSTQLRENQKKSEE